MKKRLINDITESLNDMTVQQIERIRYIIEKSKKEKILSILYEIAIRM